MTQYRNEVTALDVGARIMVRHQLAPPPPGDGSDGPGHTDVVGQLVAVVDGVWTIRRNDGEEVDVDAQAIVASKVLPPRQPRRRPRPG